MVKFLRPIVGIDSDGDKWILLSDGSRASFKDGVWYPGMIWGARIMLDFPAQKDPDEIKRLLIEADEALWLSHDEDGLKWTRALLP